MTNENHFGLKLAVSGVVAFTVGMVSMFFVDPYLPVIVSNTQKGYTKGFTAARTLVENSSLGNFFKTPDDVRSLMGTVVSIGSNTLTIEARSTNPFDALPSSRIILVTGDTKIVGFKPVLLSVDAKKKYLQYLQVANPGLTMSDLESQLSQQPSAYQQEELPFSELKVGDNVTVTASDNIKTQTEFHATTIQRSRS